MNAVCLSFILGNGKDNKVSDNFFFFSAILTKTYQILVRLPLTYLDGTHFVLTSSDTDFLAQKLFSLIHLDRTPVMKC